MTVAVALLAALLSGGRAPKHCLTACYDVDRYGVEDCLWEPADTCRRGECVETSTRACRPVVVPLGKWDPVLSVEARTTRWFSL